MNKHELTPKPARSRGNNAPQPVRTLRDWLDHLAARDRLAVLKPNVGLKFELSAYAKRLDGKGDGEVNVVLLLGGGTEVEVRLPGRFKVSPQIAGAIKAVPGVVQVEAI